MEEFKSDDKLKILCFSCIMSFFKRFLITVLILWNSSLIFSDSNSALLKTSSPVLSKPKWDIGLSVNNFILPNFKVGAHFPIKPTKSIFISYELANWDVSSDLSYVYGIFELNNINYESYKLTIGYQWLINQNQNQINFLFYNSLDLVETHSFVQIQQERVKFNGEFSLFGLKVESEEPFADCVSIAGGIHSVSRSIQGNKVNRIAHYTKVAVGYRFSEAAYYNGVIIDASIGIIF